jgi:UDP-N-acetylmuramoyl-tripeptide--D-alanyl-D-alanine ligase
MMELGEDSEKEHHDLVRLIDKYKWKNVILVGDNFKNMSVHYLHFDDAPKAGKWLKDQQVQNSQLLIKGSRSMQMEKVMEMD